MDAVSRFLVAAGIRRFLRPVAERDADAMLANPSARKVCPHCKFSAKMDEHRCPGCLRPFDTAAKT